jgi:hypothetical protein
MTNQLHGKFGTATIFSISARVYPVMRMISVMGKPSLKMRRTWAGGHLRSSAGRFVGGLRRGIGFLLLQNKIIPYFGATV